MPTLSDRFLAYGSREHAPPQSPNTRRLSTDITSSIAAIRVPHGWFTSFYVVSTSCSLLWASQVILNGQAFRSIATAVGAKRPTESMTLDQVTVTWLLMLLQGIRRLYECLTLTKPSSSRMWIGHWAFGLWYYLSINVAVWIEGSGRIVAPFYFVGSFERGLTDTTVWQLSCWTNHISGNISASDIPRFALSWAYYSSS